jgi:hypothetical protein
VSAPGIGAMLHALGGGSAKDPAAYYGRRITKAEKTGDELRLTFEDGVTIRIFDDGQSCCESRYMRTDDDLSTLVGHRLVAIETNAAKSDEFSDPDPYATHDAVFLDVKTDGGLISFSFHNEHNGYYGGFGLSVDEVTP